MDQTMEHVYAFELATNAATVLTLSSNIIAATKKAFRSDSIENRRFEALQLLIPIKELEHACCRLATSLLEVSDREGKIVGKGLREWGGSCEELAKSVKSFLVPLQERSKRASALPDPRDVWKEEGLEALMKQLKVCEDRGKSGLMQEATRYIKRMQSQQKKSVERVIQGLCEALQHLGKDMTAAEATTVLKSTTASILAAEVKRLCEHQNRRVADVLDELVKPNADEASSPESNWELIDRPLPLDRPPNPCAQPSETIFTIVETGDKARVKEFLKTVPEAVNAYSERCGVTCLQRACILKHQDVALQLIRQGADLNTESSTGASALHYAVKYDLPAVTRVILYKDPSQALFKDDEGHAPRVYALPDSEIAFMFKNGYDLSDGDHEDRTALRHFTKQENRDAMESLLDQGADPNQMSATQLWVPLDDAASNGNTELIDLLCSRGADIESGTCCGSTPLTIAVDRETDEKTSKRNEAVELLLERGAKTHNDKWEFTALTKAAYWGHADIARAIMKREDISALHDSDGRPALCIAVEFGHADVVRAILECGGDVNVLDSHGWSAFHDACIFDYVKSNAEILDILVEFGALDKGALRTANCTDDTLKLWPQLSIAARYKNEKAVGMMLAHPEIDVGVRNIDGWTPLHEAARYGNTKIAKMLLDAKAPVDGRTWCKDAETPLSLATKFKHWSVVAALIRADAPLDEVEESIRTRVREVADSESLQLLQELIE